MKITKQIAFLLLAIWLIVVGLIQIVQLTFEGIHLVQGALAIAAGVLILLDR